MFCTFEISWRTYEWASNHAPHGMIACEHTPSNSTDVIEFCEWNHILVCRYLEDAVCGCVQNGTACTNMLFAKFLDDFCTGSHLVAYHFAPNRMFKLLHK